MTTANLGHTKVQHHNQSKHDQPVILVPRTQCGDYDSVFRTCVYVPINIWDDEDGDGVRYCVAFVVFTYEVVYPEMAIRGLSL